MPQDATRRQQHVTHIVFPHFSGHCRSHLFHSTNLTTMIRSAEKRRLRALAVPFMSEQPMVGPPNCTAKDLQTPQLRQCTFDLDTIVFEDRLGGGLDGYVWKVKFGDKGPYALKVVSSFCHFVCQPEVNPRSLASPVLGCSGA